MSVPSFFESKSLPALGTWLLAMAILSAPGVSSAGRELAVGDAAPEFSLAGSDGQTYTLASILASGKDGVVLAWFPKAFTPG